MTTKPEKHDEIIEVTYSTQQWNLLKEHRKKASDFLAVLEKLRLQPIVHGSIARGDVKKNSDVDIFIPNPPSSFIIETALEQANIPVYNRVIIQATPLYAMKAYLEIDQATTISFPLMELRKVEREFYRFSGEISLTDLKLEKRVKGVDKRLMLIEPTIEGHFESTIINREDSVSKVLNISKETVMDRIHTLLKRDSVGRTGVFIKKELAPDETFELALKRLSEINPAVRRRLKR